MKMPIVILLTSDITSLQTELPVDVGSGNLFAKLLITDMNNEDTSHKIFAKVTLTNLQGSVSEICHLTVVSGDTLTVIRGQEGTVSRGWKLGDVVANFVTRGSENSFVQIEQLQGGDYAYATARGTANNLVVNLPSTYTIDSWDLKTPIVVTPMHNNSGQVTMQLILGGMVIGTFPVYKDNNSQLVRNDIIARIPCLVLLDKTKRFFNVINGNYLFLTGGTVTGDTNFTAKLQNKGNDVTTIEQFDSNKGTNGYQKLPGGLIMQWGIENSINDSDAGTRQSPRYISFEYKFSVKCFCIFTSPTMTDTWPIARWPDLDLGYQTLEITTIGFKVIRQDYRDDLRAPNHRFFWIAIGF